MASYSVAIIDAAKIDIQNAALWYNDKSAGSGKVFTRHIREKLNILRTNPYLYSIKYDDVRTVILDKFPYMIHYIIDGQMVVVLAVLHTKVNPDTYK